MQVELKVNNKSIRVEISEEQLNELGFVEDKPETGYERAKYNDKYYYVGEDSDVRFYTEGNVSADDIYYIESSNRKVTLYLRHEKIEYYDKISSLESELKPDFFRIHKGYLVNIKYVERYDRAEVKMRNGDSLLISKYKYQDFVKRYLEYILEER